MNDATAMTNLSFEAQICADRGVIAVTGPTARSFLHNLLTNDILNLAELSGCYGALLSPQGKILHDVFAVPQGENVFLDCGRAGLSDFLQKLKFYRLREKLVINECADLAVMVSPQPLPTAINYKDPRAPFLGWRGFTAVGSFSAGVNYREFCLAHGIADAETIIDADGLFPHEANFDQLNGLSFNKGCYVGQEIVSRMEHRGTARSRILPIRFGIGTVQHGQHVMSGALKVGTIIAVGSGVGLALVRLDRLAEATTVLTAETRVVHIYRPDWAKFEMTVPQVVA